MPIYEYICDDCSKEFQFLFRAGVPPVCPRCWNQKVTKQLSKFNAITSSTSSAEKMPSPAADTPHVHTSSCGHNHDASKSSCNSDLADKLVERHLGK